MDISAKRLLNRMHDKSFGGGSIRVSALDETGHLRHSDRILFFDFPAGKESLER
jgi:hypothetical protein